MSTPTIPETTPPRRRSRLAINVLVMASVLGVAAVTLGRYGRRIWQDFREYRTARAAAADSTPVGYLGVHLRKTYNDKPARFLTEENGRKLLWASKAEDGKPIYYDVTDATIHVESLSGGFGRDSIPGIDHPLFDPAGSPRGQRLRSSRRVFGLAPADPLLAYPADLLKKIEVVNDGDGPTPFVIVFDRAKDSAGFYDRRVSGLAVTFGTTGYAYGNTPDPSQASPVLYDRSSKSLWLPEGDVLSCVSGAHKGTKLPKVKTPEETTWSAWRIKHPRTQVLIGNDREKPIPAE